MIQSTKNSKEKWGKSILHIWTPNKRNYKTIEKAYNKLPANIKSNTVVIVTISDFLCIYSTADSIHKDI